MAVRPTLVAPVHSQTTDISPMAAREERPDGQRSRQDCHMTRASFISDHVVIGCCIQSVWQLRSVVLTWRRMDVTEGVLLVAG